MPRRSFERSTPAAGNIIDMNTGKPVEVPSVPILCERIRHYRLQMGIEQKELARRIGITGNSVCNWENGRGRPDVNLLPAICEALHITFYELFDVEDPTVQYTAGEQLLIDGYRQLSQGHRHAVNRMVDTLLEVQAAESCPKIRKLTFFERSLAAGIGDPTEFEDEGEPIFLYASEAVDRADCVFSVSGDSMEPEYHDGDLVLVRRIPDAPELKEGEIGAFIVGNETYIKEYREDGLHSLNPKYDVMHFSDEESVYLIGRVMGVLNPESIATETDVKRYLAIHGDAEN